MRSSSLLATALSIALASTAFAGPVGISRPPLLSPAEKAQLIERLTTAKNEAQREARMAVKGAAAANYRMQAVGLQDLIERLQNGEPVESAEINSALKCC